MPTQIPLCVDLDGTLIHSDSLFELTLRIIFRKPWLIFPLIYTLFRGRLAFKHKVASLISLQDLHLPYNKNVIKYIEDAKQQNRHIFLATAAHDSIAQYVAKQLGLFDGVLATSEQNLKANNKANKLIETFGEKGFDYIGNSKADLPVWRASNKAILVNTRKNVEKKAHRIAKNVEPLREQKNHILATLFRAIRIHQFSKNLLLFVPLISGHFYHSLLDILSILMGFIIFSMVAASVYLLNDLVDLDSDRQHHSKYKRPLASGSLPLPIAVLLIPTFLFLAIIFSLLFLPYAFFIVLATYFVLTLLYSFIIKKLLLLDTVTLALLYTIRVIAGISILHSEYSSWLLAFILFFFFSLALVKRFSEILIFKNQGINELIDKAYTINDIEILKPIGVGAGLISVLVFSLYINSAQVMKLYSHPTMLWGVVIILLYWINRLWLMAGQGLVHEDPVLFAVKDKVTWLLGLITLCLFLVS